jgi:hypothetical protein
MKLNRTLIASLLALTAVAQVNAAVFSEDFEAAFPAWESNWFGTQSTARNYYCYGALNCSDRGNNPDGLWISDVSGGTSSPVEVVFNNSFGASLTSLKLDIAGYTITTLEAYDMADALIFSQNVLLSLGAFTDPGTYFTYTINSSNGISRFTFSGNASGNTSIDNLVASTDSQQITEPASVALMGLGIAGLAALRRRKFA